MMFFHFDIWKFISKSNKRTNRWQWMLPLDEIDETTQQYQDHIDWWFLKFVASKYIQTISIFIRKKNTRITRMNDTQTVFELSINPYQVHSVWCCRQINRQHKFPKFYPKRLKKRAAAPMPTKCDGKLFIFLFLRYLKIKTRENLVERNTKR